LVEDIVIVPVCYS